MKNKFVKIIVALVNVFAALFFVTFFLLLLLALFNRADLASMRFLIIVLANISSILIFLVTSRLLRGPKTVKEPAALTIAEPDDAGVEEEEESAVPDRMITMRDGYMCELVNNGTELHFAGNGTLCPDSGYFAPYAWDIAKIVIDGYDRVAPHTFEGFFNCREVEFSAPEVHIDSMAFAHCFALCRVKANRCDLITAKDAFFDTLYDIGSWNRNDAPAPGDGAGQYIAKGPCGREFLEFMKTQVAHAAIFHFRTAELIRKGAEMGEPAMMYLYAEFINSYFPGSATDLKRFTLSPEETTLPASMLYLRAADAGSVHAKLWCAYCMDKGLGDFDTDHEAAQKMLDGINEYPKSINLTELAFISLAALDLKEKYDVLPSPDANGKVLADTMDYRSLCELMTDLGLVYAPELENCGAFRTKLDEQDYGEMAYHLHSVKKGWRDWCLSKGISIW